jgi:hypothetical protein
VTRGRVGLVPCVARDETDVARAAVRHRIVHAVRRRDVPRLQPLQPPGSRRPARTLWARRAVRANRTLRACRSRCARRTRWTGRTGHSRGARGPRRSGRPRSTGRKGGERRVIAVRVENDIGTGVIELHRDRAVGAERNDCRARRGLSGDEVHHRLSWDRPETLRPERQQARTDRVHHGRLERDRLSVRGDVAQADERVASDGQRGQEAAAERRLIQRLSCINEPTGGKQYQGHRRGRRDRRGYGQGRAGRRRGLPEAVPGRWSYPIRNGDAGLLRVADSGTTEAQKPAEDQDRGRRPIAHPFSPTPFKECVTTFYHSNPWATTDRSPFQ